MNDNKLPTCSPWGPLGCSRQKGVKIFRIAGKVREVGHVDGGWEQQQKTPQLSTSVFVGVEVYVSTCVRGRCACVCVCVCVWGCQQNTTSLSLLGLSKKSPCAWRLRFRCCLCSQHHDHRYHHQQWQSTSQGPPQAQSRSHILSEPQSQPPGHAGCKNPIHGEGTWDFWSPLPWGWNSRPVTPDTKKPHSLPGTGTRWQRVYWVFDGGEVRRTLSQERLEEPYWMGNLH